MKPKYRVGDVLYRKDTQQKATIEQIVKYAVVGTQCTHLCYQLSEPLNCGPHVIDDNYLRVDYIDSDDNYCDFKISGVPKYHTGDKIENLQNGRVVQIDLVSAHKKTHGHPWEYHVIPWLFHPNESGYHWCSHIDENTFIRKTDKDVAKDKSNRYEVGDLLVYTDKTFHTKKYYSLVVSSGIYYTLSNSFPLFEGAMSGKKDFVHEDIDCNENICLTTEEERQEWIESQGKYQTGSYVIYNGISHRIRDKFICIRDGKAEVYYSIDMEYNDNFPITLKEGDKYFKRDVPPHQSNYNKNGLKNSNDPLFVESHEQKIERQAREIWECTYKKCLETMDEDNNSTRLIQSFIKSANIAVDEFIKKFN